MQVEGRLPAAETAEKLRRWGRMSEPLSALVLAAAERWPDRVAVRAADSEVRYAELARGIASVASDLRGAGFGGGRVGVMLGNTTEFPVVLYGILEAGCGAVMLNPLYSPREVREVVADAGVELVVTDGASRALVPAGAAAAVLRRDDAGARLVVERRRRPVEGPHRPGGEAVVIYTAATEGYARGAVLTHDNLVANLRSTVDAMALTPEDAIVGSLPYIHAFGLTVGLDAPLTAGASALPVDRFHPVRVLQLLGERRATILSGVPAMYIALIAVAERAGVPDHALRIALCGGAPLEPEVALRWEELFGLPLRQGYGLTEAAPVCLFNRIDAPNQIGTLGFPFPGVEVSIRSADGDALPLGEIGEICVRGANVFAGYLGDGGRCARDFHGDWLRTGDLGSEEADGRFRFRGVLKPMFTRNGYNVYPREIARVLEEDPRIARVTAFAVPDPAREADILVRVEVARGETLSEADVRELCRANLAAYKQPARVTVVGP